MKYISEKILQFPEMNESLDALRSDLPLGTRVFLSRFDSFGDLKEWLAPRIECKLIEGNWGWTEGNYMRRFDSSRDIVFKRWTLWSTFNTWIESWTCTRSKRSESSGNHLDCIQYVSHEHNIQDPKEWTFRRPFGLYSTCESWTYTYKIQRSESSEWKRIDWRELKYLRSFA